MTLIEGIGDEVTHFFIAVFVVIIVSIAWWTTSISEQRHVRTVLLLERSRHRAHRRLTTNTEAVTITEGTLNVPQVESGENPLSSQNANTETTSQENIPPDASTSNLARVEATEVQQTNVGEEDTIINSMDAGNCVLRQRRIVFYSNTNNDSDQGTSTVAETVPGITVTSALEQQRGTQVLNDSVTEQQEVYPPNAESNSTSGITVKLKYINDDVKLVDGRLDEALGDFKRRHFQQELAANKLVRLIFNGQVLQPDTQTLQRFGLFDNCVVHCLIHQKRPIVNQSAVVESRRGGYSFPNGSNNLNNNNANRDWDLGNFLFAFVSFILLAAWYFRYVYAHLYTVTATVGLILITGIFTIILVGMYFPPDNENLPNPTIRIARERIVPAPE